MARRHILPYAAAVLAALALGSGGPSAQTAPSASLSRPAVPLAPADPLDELSPGRATQLPQERPNGVPPGLLAPPAPGTPVSMIADAIAYDREAGTITAEGNVEIQSDGRVFRASRIVYRESDDTILATGPLTLVDPEAGVLFAEEAAVAIDFSEGVVSSARLLVAGLLQLAAAEIRRSDGRYTALHRAVASSCEACPGAAPTWAIRAERIVRDEQTRLIHFRNATLEIFGLPVAWLPYMRIADPGTGRASGLLAPEFRQSSLYGFGLKVPYYQVLGPHADATLTPFITQRGGTLLEGEYRLRFRRGALDVSGAAGITNDIDERRLRGTIAATGHYDLGGGFRAELDAAAVSDDRFLSRYDYSDADRLTSTLRAVRVRALDRFELGAVAFQSLRPEEDRAQIPLILPEFRFRQLLPGTLAGGNIGIEADAVAIVRDGGRDVLRLGGTGDWRRDAVVGPGLLLGASTGAALDVWQVREAGEATQRSEARVVPWARAELRWPLLRAGTATTQVIEPVADIVWSTALGEGNVPNEDSLLPEFDETNLFARDRFPGRDRVETGLRANLGLSYSLFDLAGRTATATFGRVIRFSDRNQFGAGAGLDGTLSDWVGAVEIGLGAGFGAVNRIRFDDAFGITRNEFSVVWDTGTAGLAASWYYLAADAYPEIGPQPETSELSVAGRYRLHPNWQIRGDWRYDAATDATLRAGGGITYGNECAEVEVGVTRRFVTAGDVPSSTSFGFAVRLVGLGVSGTQDWPRRSCNG